MSRSKSQRENRIALPKSLPARSISREESRLARKFPNKNDVNYSRLISSYLAGEVNKVGKNICSTGDRNIAPGKYPYIPWNCEKEANYWRYLESIFNTSGDQSVEKRPNVKTVRTRISRKSPAKKAAKRKAIKDLESEKSDSSSQGSEKSNMVNMPTRPVTGISCDYISPWLEWLIGNTLCAPQTRKSSLRYKPDDVLYPYYPYSVGDVDFNDLQAELIRIEPINIKEIIDIKTISSQNDFNESLETESDSDQNLDISFSQANISVTNYSDDRKNLYKKQDSKEEILSHSLTKLGRVQNITNSVPGRFAKQQDNSSPNKQQNTSLSAEREKEQATKQLDTDNRINQQNAALVCNPLSGEREGTEATNQQSKDNPINQQNAPLVDSPLSDELERKQPAKQQDTDNRINQQNAALVCSPLSGERERKQPAKQQDSGNPINQQNATQVHSPVSDEREGKQTTKQQDSGNLSRHQSRTLVHSPPLSDEERKQERTQHVSIDEQNTVPSGDSEVESLLEEDPALAAEQLRIQNALRNRKYQVRRGLDAIPVMKRADIPGYLDIAFQRWLRVKQTKHKEFQRRKAQTVTKEDDEDDVHEARCLRAMQETTYALGRSLEDGKVLNRSDRLKALKRYFGLPQNTISPQVRKCRSSVIPRRRRRRPPSRCRSVPSGVSLVSVVPKKSSPKARDDNPSRSSSTSNLCIPKESLEDEVPERCKTAPPQCHYVPQLFLKQQTRGYRYNSTKYQPVSPQQSSTRISRPLLLHQP